MYTGTHKHMYTSTHRHTHKHIGTQTQTDKHIEHKAIYAVMHTLTCTHTHYSHTLTPIEYCRHCKKTNQLIMYMQD